MSEDENLNTLLETAVAAAIEAGNKILEVYNSGDFEVEIKQDNSPLTLADKKAHAAIGRLLASTGIPVLSEEGRKIEYAERKSWNRLWVVDPLDGTKEFVKRNGEFTVNIALVRNGSPVLGVVYLPVKGITYFAASGTGAWKLSAPEGKAPSSLARVMESAEKLPAGRRMKNSRPFTVIASRSHLSDETRSYIDQLRKEHGHLELISAGSALKLCLVAEGVADIYPRFAPTMEWDTAAGHAIASEAGKDLTVYETGKTLLYNRENLVNPWFILS